jgi:hypothetical protein
MEIQLTLTVEEVNGILQTRSKHLHLLQIIKHKE